MCVQGQPHNSLPLRSVRQSLHSFGPLVKWSRQRPLTPQTGVRLSHGSPSHSKTCEPPLIRYVPCKPVPCGSCEPHGTPKNAHGVLPFGELHHDYRFRHNPYFHHIFASLDMVKPHADVVELADAADSKSVGSNTMRVQVPPSAPCAVSLKTVGHFRHDNLSGTCASISLQPGRCRNEGPFFSPFFFAWPPSHPMAAANTLCKSTQAGYKGLPGYGSRRIKPCEGSNPSSCANKQ